MLKNNSRKKKEKKSKGKNDQKEYYVAWWNVENLFDVEHYKERSDKLKRTIGNELKGWNEIVLSRKLHQLAEVIKNMNAKKGPDIIGMCEVENANVLNKLIDKIRMKTRDYQVAHHDCLDDRGVDVAFIYDANKIEKGLDFSHVIMKRVATRDIYQVNFTIKETGKSLILIGNHWPARSGGVLESEPYRIVAGETLAYWNSRISEIVGDLASIIVMGDFNDEPFNRSLTDYALSSNTEEKVINAQKSTPRLFNMMWKEMSKGIGTHYYQNFPTMLDQILVSKAFLVDKGDFFVKKKFVEIIREDKMIDGKYGIPKRFGRPSDKIDLNGYSDHYPVGIKIVER
ncbi:MAG: endonuclease/exonuclease/phosphatase [Candidatus Heimdallarchaeota archaeon]|nr:endonuclease/exonuclease/phosphatase [Candidatus Heimdallarchaeota archaeon]